VRNDTGRASKSKELRQAWDENEEHWKKESIFFSARISGTEMTGATGSEDGVWEISILNNKTVPFNKQPVLLTPTRKPDYPIISEADWLLRRSSISAPVTAC
jgi:hypothetical protein